ncbi:MAG: glycosyltransferase family 4 protein [Actinomycetes bacterium]
MSSEHRVPRVGETGSAGAEAFRALVGKRIVFVNWRDHTHSQSGGAEVYCEEIARRFAEHGVSVTLLTAREGDAPLREWCDGVHYVRQGGRFDVYAHAARYLFTHRRDIDAVVDFQNGIPFFAPLFVGAQRAVVSVIHHVHQDQFRLHFPGPVAAVGRFLEGPASRLVYRRSPVVAVSPSTREAVRRRLRLPGEIFLVPNGLEQRARPDAIRAARTGSGSPTDPKAHGNSACGQRQRRATDPTIAVITRLVPQKRLLLLVEAAARLREEIPRLHIDIAGSGPSADELRSRVSELGLDDVVRLHGRVSDAERDRLLDSAWLTVVPSEREGWGLTVLEANSHGVPAVAFDVAGLRDSIVPGETGWLLPEGADLAEGLRAALMELTDTGTALEYAVRCRSWSARFDWEESAGRLATIVGSAMAATTSAPRRGVSDIATVVEVDGIDEERAALVERRLRRRLRRTDTVRRDGPVVRALLQGADEVDALSLLASAEVHVPVACRPATGRELLTGLAESSVIDLRVGAAQST